MKLGASFAFACLAVGTASADTTPQALPFTQAWANVELVTTSDDWSGVPGIIGYRGDALTSAVDADPQAIVADGSTTPVDVNANQSSGTFTTGGVSEFHITDPVVGLAGSVTADAPHLVIALNTTGAAAVRVRYDVRDLDPSADDAVQQVALQYRVGATGDFINVVGGYIADATTASADTQVTPINVVLPAAAANQPLVQLRIMTTNATGGDEYVGIDNIDITADPTPPTATGTATPAAVAPGATTTLTAAVTPGTQPASTAITVACDLTPIGGLALQLFSDDGTTGGDPTAGDNQFTFVATVDAATTAGAKSLSCTVSDLQNRSSPFVIDLTVTAVCGNGVLEAGETCDDSDTMDGDGCSATCTVEPGYECTMASPSVCTDRDECTLGTDNCDANAACSNTVGSFTCTCNSGYAGDGTTCTDVDECATGADDCDANATCTNAGGSFSCACNEGFEGDGRTCTAVMACGDGVIDTGEVCDDGNQANGDGCNATCAVEAEFVCTGMPSVCRGDRDGDGIANVDDNCPDVMNANQTDADGNAIGDACELGDDEGGCCSSSRDGGAGAWLLAFATLLGLRRRRR